MGPVCTSLRCPPWTLNNKHFGNGRISLSILTTYLFIKGFKNNKIHDRKFHMFRFRGLASPLIHSKPHTRLIQMNRPPLTNTVFSYLLPLSSLLAAISSALFSPATPSPASPQPPARSAILSPQQHSWNCAAPAEAPKELRSRTNWEDHE